MVLVPGCTAYLHPDRNPLNPNGYRATRSTPIACQVRPPPASPVQIPHSLSVSQPIQPQPALQPQVQPQPAPHTQLRSLSEAQRERILTITRQYTAVADRVQDGSTLQQALREVNLNGKMFQRRRVIAETYIALPEAVTKAFLKRNCGSDLESIFLCCKTIAKTPKGKLRIQQMAMNGYILPLGV